jgi:CRISPR-associated protein Csm2
MSIVNPNDLRMIITDPNSAEKLVQVAKELGKKLEEMDLATNQIRALFGEVRQIEAEWGMGEEARRRALRRLILLKPKMAYRARRERGRGVQELINVLQPALDEVVREKDTQKQDGNFSRFVEFFEAILAYHKAYGGN